MARIKESLGRHAVHQEIEPSDPIALCGERDVPSHIEVCFNVNEIASNECVDGRDGYHRVVKGLPHSRELC